VRIPRQVAPFWQAINGNWFKWLFQEAFGIEIFPAAQLWCLL
jgi:hypothetical protein